MCECGILMQVSTVCYFLTCLKFKRLAGRSSLEDLNLQRERSSWQYMRNVFVLPSNKKMRDKTFITAHICTILFKFIFFLVHTAVYTKKKISFLKPCLGEAGSGIPGNSCTGVGQGPAGPGLCCQEPWISTRISSWLQQIAQRLPHNRVSFHFDSYIENMGKRSTIWFSKRLFYSECMWGEQSLDACLGQPNDPFLGVHPTLPVLQAGANFHCCCNPNVASSNSWLSGAWGLWSEGFRGELISFYI